jgi:hypothetical protein
MSCSLTHVIHTDSTQYKQLQNYILSITSDLANVWVYICVLFKSNIPVVLSRFYDFHIDTFIYKGSTAIIGFCGFLTTSECVPFLLSSNDNACHITHDITSIISTQRRFKYHRRIIAYYLIKKVFYIYDLCRYIVRLTSINLQNKNS